MFRPHLLLAVMACSLWCGEAPDIAAMATVNRVFPMPADAGAVNVKDHGAVGDGIADDSEAFRRAFAESNKTGFFRPIVFVPRGTYRVTGTLAVGKSRFFSIMGEERDRTIIRLQDASPDFQDPAKPQPVLAVGGGPNNNQAFGNYVQNLTISTGKDNPGAAGLRYKASNYGATTELTIRSEDGAGVAGLLLDWGDPGPQIHRNMHIIGFDHGVRSTHSMFGPVFENILLEGQRQAGIHNINNCLWMRRVLSRNRVPAVVNGQTGGTDSRPDPNFIILLASRLEGGDGPAAVLVDGGMAYLHDVDIAGYDAAIHTPSGEMVPGPTVASWTSHPVISVPGASATPFHLPVREHPTPAYEPVERWVNVRSFVDANALPTCWADTIQRAIDSGATTLYFPKEKYTVSKTVHLRGKVRHILGMRSLIDVDVEALGDHPVFRFDGDQKEIIVEHLHTTVGPRELRNRGTVAWEHTAPGTFVLQYSLTHSYRAMPGCGPVFAMDFCSGSWLLENPGQQAWFRSINIEGMGGTAAAAQLMIDGAHTWILGFKTEGGHTCIDARNGAKVELLGGFHYPAQGFAKHGQVPLFRLTDASAMLSWSEIAHGPKRGENRHHCQIQTVRKGVTHDLMLTDLPRDLLEMKYGRVVNVPLAVVAE